MKLFSNKQKPRPTHIPNISYEKNFIFIHIPKNAGTSIYNSVGLNHSKHKTVKEYINALGKDEYENMFSFAFVRNPFSRFISLYDYARLEVSHYHNNINPEEAIFGAHMDYTLLKDKSIDEAAVLLSENKLIHNPPHVQWNPQVSWLKEDTGEINVKYLGRIEDIAFHMRNIHQLIGLKVDASMKKVNSSSKKKRDYKDLISPQTRQILEEYYKEDLERFNYDF